MTAHDSITPVILSGGSGTRLWPLSRDERPKQFIALTAAQTMLQLTLGRCAGLADVRAPLIIANAAHGALVASQHDGAMTLILEPCARNTAPAIALAALAMDDPEGLMLVMPSDHVIADLAAFHAAIARARPLAAQGWLVTFGIEPDAPETGYGYIALGEALAEGAHLVARFVEKPDVARAQAMLEAGGHAWNAGIFLLSARAYLDALAEHQPAMLAAARAAMDGAARVGDTITPAVSAFAACPSDSIDYAVMERAARVACVPVSMGWSDVGSWDALYALGPHDEAGNALRGPAHAIDTRGSLILSDGPAVTLVGVEDLLVIATADEVLILPRGASQETRKAAAAAKARKG
ncbi:MAG TPA: mannose-1-phosphate guanylyltransferase/mannose-6-phosphate isomerase [Sphingobium sp.]|nr:mannose-1-phosphate guanylyltransferase/mannose-6-phosphate isomerase [Sphingobium sp.]